jgi:hypothetical protein
MESEKVLGVKSETLAQKIPHSIGVVRPAKDKQQVAFLESRWAKHSAVNVL